MSSIHRFLIVPALLIAAGLTLPLQREARAELINPDPKACCACLDITVAGVPLAGPDPLRIPSIVEDGITGSREFPVTVKVKTADAACTGNNAVEIDRVEVRTEDSQGKAVLTPSNGNSTTSFSGTVTIPPSVQREHAGKRWGVFVYCKRPPVSGGTPDPTGNLKSDWYACGTFSINGCESCGGGGSSGGGGGNCDAYGCKMTGMPKAANGCLRVNNPIPPGKGGDVCGNLDFYAPDFNNPGPAGLNPLVPPGCPMPLAPDGTVQSINTGGGIMEVMPALDPSLLAQDPKAFSIVSKTAGGEIYRTTTIAMVTEGGIKRFRVDSTFDGATNRAEQTNPLPGTFVLDEGRIEGVTFVALRRSSHTVEKPSAGVEVHRDIIQERATVAGAWQTVSDTKTKWENQLRGWVKTQEINDPDGAALTSTWTYYQPGEQSGPNASGSGLGMIKSYQRYDGYQSFHTYALNTETTTSTYAGNPSGRVDTTAWSPETRSRTVTTTIGGVEVSRTVTTYTDTSVTSDIVTFGSTERTVTGHMPDGQDFGGKPSVVTYPDGTGTTHSYSRDPSGARTTVVNTGTAAHGTRTTTTTNSRGTEILRTVQDIVNGNVNATIENMAVTAVDTLGRATTTAWHPTAAAATGEVASATGAAWTTTTSYNCCGVASETDRNGITTFHAYDALQRPVKTNSLGVTVETVRDGLTTTTHRYPEVVVGSLSPGLQGTDATRIAKNVSNLAGTLQESWSPDVTSATPGALVTTATVTTYNANGSVRTQTNPLGGTVVTESHPDGKTKSVSGTATIAQAYTYGTHTENGNGTVTTVTTAGGVGGVTASYADKSGRTFKTTRTAPHGQTAITTTTYNAKGQAELIASSGQPSVKYIYNSEGEQVAIWTDRNGDGQFNDAIDLALPGVKDACTTSQIDYLAGASAPVGLGDCQRTITTVRTEADEGKVVSTSWQSSDGLRSRQETLGVAGATTISTVLQGGGATTTTQTSPDGTSVVTESSILANGNRQAIVRKLDSANLTLETSTSISDVLGRTIQTTNGRGHDTQYTYTANGDQLAATTQVNAAPGGGNLVISYKYEITQGTGTLVTTTLPDGSHQFQETNLLGQTTRQWGSQTNPVKFTYDAAGRKATLTTYREDVGPNANAFPNDDENNPLASVTTWRYDDSGVLLGKRDAANKEVTYTYDIAGRVLTRTWARGVVTTYAYLAGQLTSTSYTNDPVNTPTVAVTYDRLRRQISSTSLLSSVLQSSVLYAYDPATLALDSETIIIDPDGSGPQPALTRVLDRGRDTLGRYSGFQVLEPANLTLETSATYGYDNSGRLSTITSPAGTFTYGYLPNSSLIGTVTGPVHTVTNTWEPSRDVLDVKDNRIPSTINPISRFDDIVNAIGQRTGVSATGTAFNSAPANWTWGYDPLGQVKSADSPTPAYDRAYAYDQIGNRRFAEISNTEITNPPGANTTTYSANPLNQYDAVGSFTPTHDDDGNQKNARILPVGSSSPVSCVYHWDAENRLVVVKDANEVDIVRYTYDAGSRRVARTKGTDTTIYVYDGWNCVAEYALQNSSFSLQTSLTWGLDNSGTLQGAGGVGGLLATSKAQLATSYFPTFDGNGNISEYLTATGSIAAHFEYDPFGRTVVASLLETENLTLESFPYRFSTKPVDTTTGLYYYGYRWYDPETGRWINRDPIEEAGGLNLHGFVENEPLSLVDVSGLLGVYFPNGTPAENNGFKNAAGKGSNEAKSGKDLMNLLVNETVNSGCIKTLTLAGHGWSESFADIDINNGIPGVGGWNGFYLNIEIIKLRKLGRVVGADAVSMLDFQEYIRSGRIKFCCPCTIEIYACRIGAQFVEALAGHTKCKVVAAGGSCGNAGNPSWNSGAKTWDERIGPRKNDLGFRFSDNGIPVQPIGPRYKPVTQPPVMKRKK